MERCYPLAGGKGSLRLREEGLRVQLWAKLPDDGRGLYKVWLTGGDGGELLLGTLLPEGGILQLRRQMSVDQLTRAGVWPPSGGRAALVFPAGGHVPQGWQLADDLPALFSDVVLRAQAKGQRGALFRKRDGGTTVALPFVWGGAVPLEAAFCLLRPAELEGETYLLLELDASGHPTFFRERK